MHMFRTRPVKTQYVRALIDDEKVVVQPCDRNGKAEGPIRHLAKAEFNEKYEPARKERTTPAES